MGSAGGSVEKKRGAEVRSVDTLIDFNAVEAVVDATHRYKEIFYNAD